MNKKIKIEIAVGIIVVVAIIIGGAVWLGNKNNSTEVQVKVAEKQPTENKIILNEQKSDGNLLYYVTKTFNPYFKVDVKGVSRNSLDSQVLYPDLGGSMNFRALGKFKDGQYMFRSQNKLLGFDPIKKEVFEILSIRPRMEISSASVSHDGRFLAYSDYRDYSGDNIGTGKIYVYDLTLQKETKAMEISLLDPYVKVFVEGWSANDKQIIVKEIHDGGLDIKGDVYLANANGFGKAKKVDFGNSKFAPDFLRGFLSPDGEHWAYHYCENVGEYNDISREGYTSDDYSCKDGESVYVYSFADGKTEKIYTSKGNLTQYDGNGGENLNIVSSIFWQDNFSVIVSIPNGIYSVDISSKKAEKISDFEGINPQSIRHAKAEIVYANSDVVVFKRYYDELKGVFLVNLKNNNKIVDLKEDPQASYMMDVFEQSEKF